jgi:guanine deaminase
MIKDATLLPQSDEPGESKPIDVVIDGNEIVAIGNDLDSNKLKTAKVLSAQDKLIIPGLINAHLHSHDRFDKGRFDNLPLEVWMALYNPPTAGRDWAARECYLRTILGCIEMIKSGTTTAIDDLHPGFPLAPECLDAVFQAYQDIGMRARVTIAYADKPYYQTIPFLEELLPQHLKPAPNLSAEASHNSVLTLWRDFAERWKGRVQFILSPSAPQRCTDKFLRKVWDFSEAYTLPIVIHILETKVQAITGHHFYGKSIIAHMQDLGLLTPLTALVHCVWVDDHDIELIAKAGASVVHNPLSNLKLGSGVAPIGKMREAGINVGIGTDNHNASDTANLFEAMKTAALIHKVSDHEYNKWMGAKEAFHMATQGGALCGGLSGETGKIEPGNKADLVLLDLKALSFFPKNNLLNQLVFSENGSAVDTVIVDGKILMEDRRLTGVNEAEILRELQERIEKIKKKITAGIPHGRELEPYLREAYYRCIEMHQTQK